jgi:hypothetical protein
VAGGACAQPLRWPTPLLICLPNGVWPMAGGACAHRPSLGNRPTPFFTKETFSLKGFGRLPSRWPSGGWSMCSAPSLANPLIHKTKHVCQMGFGQWQAEHVLIDHPCFFLRRPTPFFTKETVSLKGFGRLPSRWHSGSQSMCSSTILACPQNCVSNAYKHVRQRTKHLQRLSDSYTCRERDVHVQDVQAAPTGSSSPSAACGKTGG